MFSWKRGKNEDMVGNLFLHYLIGISTDGATFETGVLQSAKNNNYEVDGMGSPIQGLTWSGNIRAMSFVVGATDCGAEFSNQSID